VSHAREWSKRDRAEVLELLSRAGFVVCVAVGALLGVGYAVFDTRPVDAALFWNAGHSANYYGEVWSQTAGYIYPPPLAQMVGLLPWPLFIVPWMLLIFVSLWYATRWLAGPIVVVGCVAWYLGGSDGLLPSIFGFAAIGNPQTVIAAAIVLGFKHPSAWAFVILTKIGPGIGVLWFAFRREWRKFGTAIGATALIAAVSFALSPGAWIHFIQFAANNYATPSPVPVVPVPLYVRVPMTLMMLWWAARTNRPWLVLVACGWAALALYQWSYMTLWAAAVTLLVDARLNLGAMHAGDPAPPRQAPSPVAPG
jgi:hypothetical protein